MDIAIERNKVIILANDETGMHDVWHGANVLWSAPDEQGAAEWANKQGYEIEQIKLAQKQN